MPSKQSNNASGSKANAASKGQKSNAAAATNTNTMSGSAASAAPPASAASPATAPSFDSLPHATSGERLKGVEVSSTIPALMSELGVLLQQTPGSGSGGGGIVSRGQNGGLLFEDVDFTNSLNDSSAAAAAAVLCGDDVSRRLDQIPPSALERLSQVFQLQRRQAQAAAVSGASSKGGSCGSASADVAGSEDDEGDDEADGASGSSGATGHTTPAPALAASATATPGGSMTPGGGSGGRGGGSDYDPYSTAGRRHNLEEMFELMQRSIGNYARGAAAAAASGGSGGGGGNTTGSLGGIDGREKGVGVGAAALAGDTGLDPSAYSDPLTQLELFRAMMVATSKGRTGVSGITGGGPAGGGVDGKGDDTELRTRSQRGGPGVGVGSGGGSGIGVGGATATGPTGGRVPGSLDSPSSNPFQSFLDVLGPQLFGQVRLQQRAAAGKAAAAAAALNCLSMDADATAASAAAGVAPATARDVDMSPGTAANLSDLQKRVEQVRVLSSSTLEELIADEVSDSTSDSLRNLLLVDAEGGLPNAAATPDPGLSSAKVGYCLTEAAAVAVSMLWSFLGSQQKEAPLLLGLNREAAQSQFNLLLFRLRKELAEHLPADLADVARCFGGGVAADADDVYRAINGVGVMLFFTCKPLPLLERTCAELGVSLSDSANADTNVMPELIAEKLAAFFYPMKGGKLSFAHLSFVPRVQVHEHAPGNYTCTIDNASNMGRMLRERLLSNRFSCNKIKWRAAIVNDKGALKFLVWHRSTTPLSVHLLARTSEPKKKKRSGSAKGGAAAAANTPEGANNNNSGNNGEEKEMSATDELRANSALFMERQATAAPGEMIGFADDFLDLTVALSSPTTLQRGYRTYNKVDDRLVFQFSLQLRNMDGTPLDDVGANGNRAGSKVATPQQQQAGDEAETNVNGSTAGRTDGGDSKDDIEAEVRAAVCAFVEMEAAARAVIVETANVEYRHLQNDECRDAHQSRRRAEDRERKALLAKVGPPPELIKEVEKLSLAVQAMQQQISKLNKERAKDDKENAKMTERLEQQQGDLSKVLFTLASGERELAKLEEETKAAERRIEDKRARLTRKEAKKAEQNQWTALKRVLEPTSSSTHHDTLAINDFGSFLHSSSVAAAAAATATQLPPAGGNVYSTSISSSGSGGLTAFATDPFYGRQASTTPPAGAVNTTPVFSTQPKMGMTANSSFGASTAVGGAGSTANMPTHHPLLDSVGGGGGSSSTPSKQPGMVSPMVPPSPGVTSNASAAMGGHSSPASVVAGSLGSPGMSLNTASAMGSASGRNGASQSTTMMMGTGNPGGMNNGTTGLGPSSNGGPAGGGGLSFGLAPSLFSTNPVSHASHANIGGSSSGGGVGPGMNPSTLYPSLDVNAQPFSPSPPPGSPGAASTSNHSHGAGSNAGGGGGFNFTVTAGAGVYPGLGGGTSSPLYQAGGSNFTNGHELVPHSPSPFSTTPVPNGGNGLFMMSGGGSGGGLHGSLGDLAQHHQGMFPPQPHSASEVLSFSTALQWRN
jgi:hypothetical protein